MSMLTSEDYRNIAEQILNEVDKDKDWYGVVDLHNLDMNTYMYNGRVQPKQRPQFKGGRAYTPKETKEFEKEIRVWAQQRNMEMITYPVRVDLHIFDVTDDVDKILHSKLGITYPNRGDLDNLSKGILDALNGIAYVDDKQVVTLNLTRSWSALDGFTMNIRRAGLSKFEYDNLLKYIKKAG